MKSFNLFLIAFCLTASASVFAQTSAFTYQGSLDDNLNAANGAYQMRFSLYAAQTGGNPVGGLIELPNVQVTDGVFSVSLDFGAAAFDGNNRFLQIEVRRNAGENYVPLNPRQPVNSVPYAVRSATSGNADQLGGVSSSQYVTISSNAFINNGTSQQSGNFNISGMGTASSFDANVYRLEGSVFLRRVGNSIFLGRFAGNSKNTGGSKNIFIGEFAGFNHTTGSDNIFIGEQAGVANGTGSLNTFIGNEAGSINTDGVRNTFVGLKSGWNTTTGNRNTFFGVDAGRSNATGSDNTMVGENADVGSSNLSFATAIGADSKVNTSNTVQLGRTSDRTNVSGTLNVLNGRTAFNERGNVNFYSNSGDLNLYMQGGNSGDGIVLKTETPSVGNSHFFISHFNGNTYEHRLVVKPDGRIEIRVLGTGGNEQLCRNSATNAISTCSSSMRYKSNVASFSGGLNIIKKLRPVSFNWTDGGMLDFGLVAEEVADVEPLLTTQNADGKTEGVKYDRVGVVLVNAVKEQQEQIENQAAENEQLKTKVETLENTVERQNRLIENLRVLVCADKPEAEICRIENKEEK